MSLRVWLPLTKDLRNQGLDEVTVTNNGATFNANGKLGGCYSFNGSNNKIEISNAPNPNNISIALWFKRNANTNTRQFLYTQWNGITVELETDGRLTCSVNTADGQTGYCRSTVAITTSSGWNHIVYTYKEGTGTNLYLNGALIASATVTKPIGWSTTVGNIGYYNTYFNGLMNDFRIYDHALSPMEVKELSKGLILHYPLNRNGWGQENLHKNSDTITSTWSVNQGTVSNGIVTITPTTKSDRRIYQMPTNGAWSWQSGKTYTASIDARSPNGAILIFFPYGAGAMSQSYTITSKWKRYSFTFTATQSGTSSMTYHVNQTSGVSLQLKHPKLEEGSIATPWCPNSSDALATTMGVNDNIEYDASGYGNNGTRTGIFNWTSDTPKYQVSSVFDSSSIIDTPVIITSTSLISQYTAAVWIKRNNIDTTNNHCFFTGPIELFVQGSTSHIRFYWSHATSTSSMVNNTWDPSVTINNSIWTHIVVTFADGVLKCYINGELSNTSDRSSTGQYIYGNKYHTIGSYHDTTEKFIGQICDVRAYATALSATDIKSLYNNSAYIDNQGNIYGAVYEEV